MTIHRITPKDSPLSSLIPGDKKKTEVPFDWINDKLVPHDEWTEEDAREFEEYRRRFPMI